MKWQGWLIHKWVIQDETLTKSSFFYFTLSKNRKVNYSIRLCLDWAWEYQEIIFHLMNKILNVFWSLIEDIEEEKQREMILRMDPNTKLPGRHAFLLDKKWLEDRWWYCVLEIWKVLSIESARMIDDIIKSLKACATRETQWNYTEQIKFITSNSNQPELYRNLRIIAEQFRSFLKTKRLSELKYYSFANSETGVYELIFIFDSKKWKEVHDIFKEFLKQLEKDKGIYASWKSTFFIKNNQIILDSGATSYQNVAH